MERAKELEKGKDRVLVAGGGIAGMAAAMHLAELGIEVFLVPGFGIAGLIAFLCIGASIFLALIGNLPTWGDVTRASGIIFMAGLIVIAAIYLIVRQLPARAGARGIFLKTATSTADGFVSGIARGDLTGHEGVTITDLRPAGTIKIDDERLDVVSDVGFVPKGKRVRIIRSESYRHVVEPVDESAGA